MGLRTWIYEHTGIKLKKFEKSRIAQLEAKIQELQSRLEEKQDKQTSFDFKEYCKKK